MSAFLKNDNNSDTESDMSDNDEEYEMKKPRIKILSDTNIEPDADINESDSDNESVKNKYNNGSDDEDDDDDEDNDSVRSDENLENVFTEKKQKEKEDETKEDELKRQFQLNDMSESDGDDDEDEDENYLQKFDENIQRDIIQEHHPEMIMHNYQEVEAMVTPTRDENGIIIDPLHRTNPFITRYEYARVLGERAKQINAGAKPFVKTEENLIDGYLIALQEFKEKKIPFIIKRPLPNGGCEYWALKDLENIM